MPAADSPIQLVHTDSIICTKVFAIDTFIGGTERRGLVFTAISCDRFVGCLGTVAMKLFKAVGLFVGQASGTIKTNRLTTHHNLFGFKLTQVSSPSFGTSAVRKAVVGISPLVHFNFFCGGVSETNLALAPILALG
jgi:hypothetical protein